jgi:hypothetical protein
VLARRDVLASKRFASQPRGQAVHQLAWQDYPATLDVESRLSRLCWRVLQCEKAGQHYRLQLPGYKVEPQPGQRERALAALAEFTAIMKHSLFRQGKWRCCWRWRWSSALVVASAVLVAGPGADHAAGSWLACCCASTACPFGCYCRCWVCR